MASTNASSKNPRAMPAWLVTHDHDEAGAVQQPDRVDAVGKEADAIEAIEIADLLDERAVAIEKHGRLTSGPHLCRVPHRLPAPSRA